MKKYIILALALIFGAVNANAQFGSIIEKAAKKAQQKTEEKIIEKTTEKVADKVSNAIVDQIDIPDSDSDAEYVEGDEPLTYEGLMKMLPAIPSASDMVNYKKAQLNGQSLKLLTSSVMKFQMSILDLTSKIYNIPSQEADSAQIMDAAYRSAELYTGLTREEIDMLATMSEDEQNAYLQTHYQEGQAEAVLLQQAAELGEEMEPIQPIIDRWSNCDNKVAAINEKADEQCKTIYAKYANQLAKAEGDDEAYNRVLLKYYEEVAPIIRESVTQSCKVRLNEQLPIAMEIEEQMVSIREKSKNAVSTILNYPLLTATQYFTETLKIMEIPEFPDE